MEKEERINKRKRKRKKMIQMIDMEMLIIIMEYKNLVKLILFKYIKLIWIQSIIMNKHLNNNKVQTCNKIHIINRLKQDQINSINKIKEIYLEDLIKIPKLLPHPMYRILENNNLLLEYQTHLMIRKILKSHKCQHSHHNYLNLHHLLICLDKVLHFKVHLLLFRIHSKQVLILRYHLVLLNIHMVRICHQTN